MEAMKSIKDVWTTSKNCGRTGNSGGYSVRHKRSGESVQESFRRGKKSFSRRDRSLLYAAEIIGDETHTSITYPELVEDVAPGDTILIDDGLIGLRVKKVNDTEILCIVENGGELGEKKGVNVPNVKVMLPDVTDKDWADIRFGIEQGIDFVAASFVRSARLHLPD